MWAFLLVRLLIAWGINILALIVVDWMFDSIYIERWGSLLLGAAVLAHRQRVHQADPRASSRCR